MTSTGWRLKKCQSIIFSRSLRGWSNLQRPNIVVDSFSLQMSFWEPYCETKVRVESTLISFPSNVKRSSNSARIQANNCSHFQRVWCTFELQWKYLAVCMADTKSSSVYSRTLGLQTSTKCRHSPTYSWATMSIKVSTVSRQYAYWWLWNSNTLTT